MKIILVPLGCLAGCFSAIFGGILLIIMLLAVAWNAITGSGGDTSQNVASTTVAGSALALSQHIYGPQTNEYSTNDSLLQQAMSYWRDATCNVLPASDRDADGLCYVVKSGTLQCVQFVKAAYALAGDPLPAWGMGNAIDFWDLYKNHPDWLEIPGNTAASNQRSMPLPGDIAVWSSPAVLVTDDHGKAILDANGKRQYVVYGHDAIVVKVEPPAAGKAGWITFAQANAPGNLFDASKEPLRTGNLSRQALYPDLSIATGKDYPFLGYIRHLSLTTAYRMPVLDENTVRINVENIFPDVPAAHRVWIQQAFKDALKYHISPTYFLNQIHLESGFDPTMPENSAGAAGIAQFLKGTAACIGIDPGTHACISIDRMDGYQALDGAAYMMDHNYLKYKASLGLVPNAEREAYAMALAEYNAGGGTVDGARAHCPTNWRNCLGSDVTNYIRIVMG